jgi:hypothetical protein
MGVSICLHMIGGLMFGIEYVWGSKLLILDLGILRFTFEFIRPEDIEYDE